MKIIDKNKDFYDYYQNIYLDNSLVFDRRDSYELSKRELANYFSWESRTYKFGNRYFKYNRDPNMHYILLQVGNVFWLFELTTKEPEHYAILCTDYDISFIHTWKDYDAEAKTIELSEIDLRHRKTKELIAEEVVKNGFKYKKKFNKFRLYKGACGYEDKYIPILKNLGIASFIEPLDIYLALEEYFAKQKTLSERTDPIGMTNNDKIIEHGFDTKTSFRGK